MKITLTLFARGLNVIGLANGAGGRHLGCESAVQVLKNSPILKKSKIPINWSEIIPETVTGRSLKNYQGVLKNSRQLCAAVDSAIRKGNNNDLLVLGGDHSCAIGTWSGVAKAYRKMGDVGLIWVDAHMDAHTLDSSPTGNIHGMPVAHILGVGDYELRTVGDLIPKIRPENLVMVGIRSFEPPEQELLEKLGVKIFYDEDVKQHGLNDVMSEAIERVSRKTYGFGMSIDIDGFRVEDAPAVGTPEDGGIVAKDFINFMKNHPKKNLLVTEIVEFLPERDIDGKSEKLITELIEAIYEPLLDSKASEENMDDLSRRGQTAHA